MSTPMPSCAGRAAAANNRDGPKLGVYISRASRVSALVPSNTSLERTREG